MRTDAGGDPTFAELLARSRTAILEAYDDQELPLALVVEALRPERGGAPLLEVEVLWQNQAPPELVFPGVEVEPVGREVTAGHTNFPFALDLIETAGRVIGRLACNRSLFDVATALRWRGHLTTLLAAVAADPERRLDELPLLDAPERHQVMVEWREWDEWRDWRDWGEAGGVVLAGGRAAPIGIWGQLEDAAPDRDREPAGRRFRRRADGTLEARERSGAIVPDVADVEDVAANALPVAEAAPAAPPPPSVAKRLGDQARRLEGLSPAKRKLFEMRLRGESAAGAGSPRGGARPSSSPLVDLRAERRPSVGNRGDRPPFFCVHAIGGAVLSYRELARALGPRQPFYGIRAGLAGGKAIDEGDFLF